VKPVSYAVRVSAKGSLGYQRSKRVFYDPYEAREYGRTLRIREDDRITVVVSFPDERSEGCD
jgi:hypothetical protein